MKEDMWYERQHTNTENCEFKVTLCIFNEQQNKWQLQDYVAKVIDMSRSQQTGGIILATGQYVFKVRLH